MQLAAVSCLSLPYILVTLSLLTAEAAGQGSTVSPEQALKILGEAVPDFLARLGSICGGVLIQG